MNIDYQKRTRTAGRLRSGFAYGLLSVLAFLAIYPILFSIITSFRTEAAFVADKLGMPSGFYLGNFEHVLKIANLFRYLGNSVIFVVCGTALYLIIIIPGGYAFGQLRYRHKHIVFGAVLFLMIMPQMILSIPMYKTANILNMTNSLWGAIIICTAFFAPYGCYIMTTYFADVPQSIRESAKIDGAGSFRTLRSIMAPIGFPMIATVSIIGFTSFWNELPFSVLLLQDQKIKTLVLGVALMRGEYGMATTYLAAAIVIGILVPLSVFLFFQRKIDGGATAGSLKG